MVHLAGGERGADEESLNPVVSPRAAGPALLTALLLDRPLCTDCIREKARLAEASDVDAALRRHPRRILKCRRSHAGRARA